jgi:plastocyanin
MSAGRMRGAVIAAVVGMIGLIGAGLVLLAPPSSAANTSATIEHYMFMPAEITVTAGDVVTWTNQDEAPHTVTSVTGPAKFDSGNLNKGQSFALTFATPGSYTYYCSIHPDMKGKVTVNAAAASPPATTGTTTPPAPGAAATSHPPEPAPGTSAPPSPPATPPETCDPAVAAALDPFVVHLDHAHLEASPGQQVSDVLNLDQYVKTHTVLLENMFMPLYGVLRASFFDVNPFVVHLDHAHLEASPAQQVSDILNVSQYVKTHTVLVENMLAPTTSAADGGGACGSAG